ncbi:alpha amylase catalytic region (plasmid) [Gemmatirosa kalamazoonensis]|uniref:Alpha amylase catalytic region n=1 Tax=Gemmatirosa kalamazoonensis TaxID=861299 RepID=W0RPZ6_9BACT|nr:alpha-amylase family protein [Gemmatirosa kalamazoonensis]AHG93074.1 alpha amylase catalytic region [Gemmatirosa kalamazoonensis]
MIEDLWYKNAVIYSLSLEAFMDGNGDGCGDFEGLTRRLDYLESLGVSALWLGPFQPSPWRDNGYDISDFYGVDPRFGSSGDFVEFMQHAHGRGIRVLIDLVVNHTSDRHQWFQEARRDPASKHRSWYVWSKTRPKNWNKGMVFPGVQTSTWTKDAEAGAYYYHRFYDFQPDLNMDDPDVRTEVRRIMGYWLQLGVSGFRVDAVPFVIEGSPGPSGRTPPLHFEYLAQMRSFLEWRTAGAIMLGEANVLPPENKKYFGAHGDGIHMMFNFFVNQHLFYALASGDARPLAKALLATKALPPSAQWAHFLRNHDELDLGRLTDEQRAKVMERFGPTPEMQLYDRGIRRRLASMVGERSQLELAYSVLFALPGTPVLRYGDEIGMGEDLKLKERDAVRTPMQWSAEAHGGFSTAERCVKPVLSDGPYGFRHLNVESQRRDPNSMLNWTVRMIRLRKECPEIGWGTWRVLPTRAPEVLALCYSWRGNTVVTVHNFSGGPREVRFSLDGVEGGDRLSNLMVNDEQHADAGGVHRVALEAFGYKWYRAGGLGYALKARRDSGAGVAW